MKIKGIEYEEKNIADGHKIQDLLEMVPNAKTMPQIWLNEEHLGGYSQSYCGGALRKDNFVRSNLFFLQTAKHIVRRIARREMWRTVRPISRNMSRDTFC